SMYEEALDIFQKINNKEEIIMTYAKMGKRSEAIQLLDDLLNQSKEGSVYPFGIAIIYFILGEDDKGFLWLDRAFQSHSVGMFFVKVEPEFDTVREDPRFKALLKKMNLD
ncbi:MAG: hypothetical protein JXB23_07545, partial [Candidatus Aminicenantes bacterium]|nr:hypothetical protein [Candidatus Aminicenantes bacterium]